MITKLVKLTLISSKSQDFVNLFLLSEKEILGFKGCRIVKLYRDIDRSDIYFTYSEWDSEADLNFYRNSIYFQSLWKKAKTCFSSPAQAWSLDDL